MLKPYLGYFLVAFLLATPVAAYAECAESGGV